MKRFLLWLCLGAIAAFLLGVFFAMVVSSAPGEWVTQQPATGRPPRLIALLTLGPILLVGAVALVARFLRKRKQRRELRE
jgi:multisubunit Na+/H+ antiporter MnhE subunit